LSAVGAVDLDAPVSTLAARIVQAAVRPDVSVSELGELAELDPAFAVRLLSVINSPAYGLSRRVSDLRHAASLLGIRALRNLALSLSLCDMAPLGAAGEALLAISLRRGAAAMLVAEASSCASAEGYFTVGLLLEVGLLVRARQDLAGVADLARGPAAVRPVRERASGVEAHPHLGAALATKWQLSAEIAAAIDHHHDPTPPDEPLGRVAWVAERVSAVYEGGDLGANRTQALAALRLCGIGREAAEAILRDLPHRLEDAAAACQRSVGPQAELDELLRDANASLVELNRSYQDLVRTLESLVVEKEALAANLRAANARLEQLAATDPLTGLLNRRAFQDALERDLARSRRSGDPLCLIMADVDHFKRINDTHGHQAGDAFLRGFGQLLRDQVREGDVASRFGGEEFALILPATDVEGGTIVAERLRTKLTEITVAVFGAALQGVTASFGVASEPACEGRGDMHDLVRRADEALYDAKRAGRNRVARAR
jgi:diguanylate cyclase (GGDEF)-like protein